MAGSRSGSEQRRLSSKPVGVRLDDDHAKKLADISAASGMTCAQYLRQLFVDHLTDGKVASKLTTRSLLAAEDRAALATFSRHAGRLTGALVQTAKAARVDGGLVSYHAAVEALLAEIRDLKKRIDRLSEEHDR